MFDAVEQGLLEDGDVFISGFGRFWVETKEPHQARNPRTGETVTVPERKFPRIKYSEKIREKLNA